MPEAKKQTKKPVKDVAKKTVALHGSDDDGNHLVGIANLRVVVVNDDNLWTAQGIEIDYAAQGDSLEDAKKQFEEGLVATVQLHLKNFGNIEKLLKWAPTHAWKPLQKHGENFHFSQLSVHELAESAAAALPFDGIEYLQPCA